MLLCVLLSGAKIRLLLLLRSLSEGWTVEPGGSVKSFDKYTVIREIGRGGMGVVYLAEDTMLGRKVALKVLHRTLTSGGEFEQRFWLEARTLANLAHPNIVQIHALDRIGDDLVIVMPYIAGGSLGDALGTKGILRNELLGHVRSILGALASCHIRGVIHRDVKPSNILLESGHNALLTDFGLAKLVADHYSVSTQSTVSSGFFLGTPRYAPPESWDGLEPTPAWDVYSVGTVLYEALASHTPYDAESPFALVKQIIERPISPLRDVAQDISPELSDAVGNMLARDPAVRPPNAGEALTLLSKTPEFDAAAEGGPPQILRIKPLKISRSRTGQRGRRALWGKVALAVLVILLVGAAFWFGGLDRRPAPSGPQGLAPPNFFDGRISSQTFDMVDALTQESWPGRWLMAATAQPDEYRILASTDTRVMFLHGARSGENALQFDGFWAEYTDQSARLFRQGALEGAGQWRGRQNVLTVSLDYRSAPDGYRWRRPYVLELASQPLTIEGVVREMEGNGHLMRLIYYELLPRNLAWAGELEDAFLAPVASRTVAPSLGGTNTPIHVDGKLDEIAWRPLTSPQGEVLGALPGRPEGRNGRMLVRYNTNGVYLGLRSAERLVNPSIVLSLQTHYAIPIEHSPRWWVRIENGMVSASEHTGYGRTLPWECAWNVEPSSAGTAFVAEVFIPFNNLESVAAPELGERWRLNCSLSRMDGSDSGPTIYWGTEEVKKTEHGAIIVFGPRSADSEGLVQAGDNNTSPP